MNKEVTVMLYYPIMCPKIHSDTTIFRMCLLLLYVLNSECLEKKHIVFEPENRN